MYGGVVEGGGGWGDGWSKMGNGIWGFVGVMGLDGGGGGKWGGAAVGVGSRQ